MWEERKANGEREEMLGGSSLWVRMCLGLAESVLLCPDYTLNSPV